MDDVVNVKKWILIYALVLLGHPSLVLSKTKIYRCIDGQGSIVYQQFSCYSASSFSSFYIDSPLTGFSGLRKGEKDLYKLYKKRDAQVIKKNLKARAKVDKTKIINDERCWKKRRQLIAINKKLRQGYRPVAGAKLRDSRSNHYDYIKQFCS